MLIEPKWKHYYYDDVLDSQQVEEIMQLQGEIEELESEIEILCGSICLNIERNNYDTVVEYSEYIIDIIEQIKDKKDEIEKIKEGD